MLRRIKPQKGMRLSPPLEETSDEIHGIYNDDIQ
jgi:hypothetical protein